MDAVDHGRRLFLAASASFLISQGRSQTPETSNTGVSKRQSPSASGAADGRESGGCDWFEAGLYGSWPNGFQDLAVRFGDLKRSALEDETPVSFDLPCGTPALMHPRGVTMGCGGFEWVFEAQGIKFFIANRAWGDENRISVWFRAGGETCMVLGHLTVFSEVIRILSVLGFHYVKSSTPSRFDACIDLAGWTLQPIKEAWDEGRCIKRVDKWKIEGEALDTQTIEFGKRGGNQIVFYDKLAELRRDGEAGVNNRKYEYLCERRWQCEPESALRVELRIKGDWLRRNTDIRSCEEFFSKLPELIRYLLAEEGKGWIKFVDDVPDRDNNHTQRAELANWWKEIIAEFLAWAGHDRVKLVKPPRRALRLVAFPRWRQFKSSHSKLHSKLRPGWCR